MIGRRIGKYELLEALGRGGQAAVYRAREADTGRIVAVKLLGRTVEPGAVRRFMREGEILARLSHPNIVGLYDVAEADDYLLSSLEFVAGDDLAGILEGVRAGGRPPLRPRELLSVAVDLLAALHYVHGVDLLHRDVKPANVLVDREGRAHLGDFGLALFRDLTRLTQTGQTVGTLRYMSPEQLRGEQLDRRSDLYQTGLVLYEMAFGELPFPGDNQYAQAMARTTSDVPVPASSPAGLDRAFVDVVRRALARAPDARFPDAAAFAQALASVAVTSGVDPLPLDLRSPPAELKATLSGTLSRSAVTRVTKTHQAPRPRRPLRWLGAALAVALGALLVAALGSPADRAIAAARTELAAGRPAAALLALGAALTPPGGGPASPEAASLLDDLAPRLLDAPDGQRAALLTVGLLGPGARLGAAGRLVLARAAAVEARSLAGGGRTTAAEDLLRRAEAAGVGGPEGRLLAAQLAQRRAAPAAARALVEACLADEPGNVEARRLQARLAAAEGARTWAEEALREALRSAPGDRQVRLELAAMVIDGTAPQRAEETRTLLADDAAWREATPAEAARRLGLLARADAVDGLLERALERADRADRLSPNLQSSVARFFVHRARFESTLALKALEQALALAPENRVLRLEAHRRALLLNRSSSDRHLEQLAESDPGYAAAMREVGSVFATISQARGTISTEAMRAHAERIERAGRERPDDPAVLSVLAAFRLDEGDLDEAEALSRRALAQLPDLHTAWFMLGRIHARRGRPAEAEEALRRAVRSLPFYKQAIQELFLLWQDRDEFAKQVAFLDGLLAERPNDLEYVINRAQSLASLGRADEATASLRALLDLEPAKLPGNDAPPAVAAATVQSVAGPRLVAVHLHAGRPAPALDEAGRLLALAARSLAPGADSALTRRLGAIDASLARDLLTTLDRFAPELASTPCSAPPTWPAPLAARAVELHGRARDAVGRLTARFGTKPLMRLVTSPASINTTK